MRSHLNETPWSDNKASSDNGNAAIGALLQHDCKEPYDLNSLSQTHLVSKTQ